jgi:hypothetical protein
MTIAKILATAIVLSVNLASPAFSSNTGRKVHKVHQVSHYSLRSYRDSHNQFGAPSQQARGWCSEEPGNPYNEDTDYVGWSAWRALGA